MNMTKKYVLYIAFAFVSMLLWQAWVKDSQVKVVRQQANIAASAQGAATAPDSEGHQAISSAAGSTVTPLVNSDNKSSIKLSPDNKWISVKTDTLAVQIDPKEGKIVRAQLLDYFKTMKKQDPVELLNPNNDAFYVADGGVFSKSLNKATPVTYLSSQKNYVLADGEDQLTVKLTGKTAQGLTVNKIFTFNRGKYDIGINQQLINTTGSNWQGHLFHQIQKLKTKSKSGYLSMRTFTGAAYSTPEVPYNKLSYETIATDGLSETVQGGWTAFQIPYFLTAWVPSQDQRHHYFAFKGQDNIYTIGFTSPEFKLKPNQSVDQNSKFYVGPEIVKNLKPLAKGLSLTVDYGWLWFISTPIFWVMDHIHSLVGNWGLSIILVTLFIKLLFYKLSETSYRSMARMRQLQPKLESLKSRYGDDRQKLGQATMELYKKEKVNPLGGCLPMLVQIPVFIGLYYVLIESVQLRHAPFVFWIHNLSAKDPYYVLPVLMGISMFMQQRLSPKPADPAQAKMMMALPIVFTIFFASFPAGLVLYWLVNNCLSILQQWYIMRRMSKKSAGKKRRK